MQRRAFMPPACCARCGVQPPLGETLFHYEVWLCATCLAKESPGKDATSRTAFYSVAVQSNRTQAMQLDAAGQQEAARNTKHYSHWRAQAADLLKQAANNRARAARVALGEVIPEEPGYLKDTLAIPDLVALDASTERTRLLMADGVDALALALDAANSAGAKSSLEKMHIHQLAILHKTALEQFRCASYTTDADLQTKRFSTASRLIRDFQAGLIALMRLRRGGIQIVQHVHVGAGAQAIVGAVQTGGQPT